MSATSFGARHRTNNMKDCAQRDFCPPLTDGRSPLEGGKGRVFKSSATSWTRGFGVPRVLQSGGLLLCLLLAACATQAPQPTAGPPVVAQAPKHHPRHIITAAEILAAQPADVQQIIANHQQGERWPTVRHGSK